MKGYSAEEAKSFILERLNKKEFRSLEKELPDIISDLIAYDLHFMRLTGVMDESGEEGENEYDDDEAFEYIYDAWLSDHPDDDDEDMLIAALLNEYMELQYLYLQKKGLA